MSLFVPHFSQDKSILLSELGERDALFWSENACGIICTRMAIAALTDKKIPLTELLSFATKTYDFIDYAKTGEKKSLPIFSEKTGWLNYALIKKVAAKYGVFGRWYFEEMPENAIQRIQTELEKNNVVAASVRADFDHSRGPHLIIITGIDTEAGEFIINDPLRHESSRVSFGLFFSVHAGRILVFSSVDCEEFRALTPISIEKTEISSPIAIIHIHGNEVPAYSHGKKYAKERGLSSFSLVQNGERFLRLPTGAPERETIETQYVRLDANRIFSKTGLEQTIRVLNKHLKNEAHIADIKSKGVRIADTFIREIKEYDSWIVVHNNFSNSGEYEKYGNFFGMKNIPELTSFLSLSNYEKIAQKYHLGATFPRNAFVLVNSDNDFTQLREADVNVALIHGHDEIGSLGEIADTLKKQYFCIETGYEDEASRDMILGKILELTR